MLTGYHLLTLNGWLLSLPSSSNYLHYDSTIYFIFMSDNTTEFIFNSASILLQYHMHGFIGSTVFIRSQHNDGAIFLRNTYTMLAN
jgi:hypothetical protein